MSVIDVIKYDDEKEPTLGEQIDVLIAGGNKDLAPQMEAFRRLLVSRIKGATFQQINDLPFSTALSMVNGLTEAINKAAKKHNIDKELMERIMKSVPKGPGQ